MNSIVHRLAQQNRRRALWTVAGTVGGALLATWLLLLTDRGGELPDYSLAAVRSGESPVPRAYPSNLPEPDKELRDSTERKDRFVRTVLPLILRANEAIERDRRRLLRIIEVRRSGQTLTRRDRKNLIKLANRYKTSPKDLKTLARRVDIVPPSLALAQAAVESAWGTSRFAIEGNALFGVRTWHDSKGIVPQARAADDRHAVKSYGALADSVRIYMWTLNTHPAYRAFRRHRADLRAKGGSLDVLKLVPGIKSFSETGARYVSLVGNIIRRERLWEFDRTRLMPD